MAKELTTDHSYEVVLQSDQPVIIDFRAQGCGPCRIVGPLLDEIHFDYDVKAIVGKVDL